MCNMSVLYGVALIIIYHINKNKIRFENRRYFAILDVKCVLKVSKLRLFLVKFSCVGESV